MNTHPYKSLISRLPRFSRLVKRGEFIAALAALRTSGRIRVEDRATVAHQLAQRLTVTADYSPWKIGGTPSGGVTVQPSFIRVPGRATCVFPTLGGVSVLEGGRLFGSGFVCLVVSLRQKPRLMNWIYRISGNDELSAAAQVLLTDENTIELQDDPEIVITENTGTVSEINANAGSSSWGHYHIPLGHISDSGIVQFISSPVQVSLKAGFLHLRRLDADS